MNELQIFNSPEFGDIRTITINNEIFFVGRDVAIALGYSIPHKAIRDNIEPDDVLTQNLTDSIGRVQKILVINECGLYDLVMNSKLPSAKKFRRWITHDVIPSIRKTGSYNLPTTPDEKIKLIAQGYVEIRQEVNEVKESVSGVKNEIQELRDELPIFLNEAQLITDAVKKRGVDVMGGMMSPCYNDKSMRCSVYHDIYSELYRQFGITTYKAIRRNQLTTALNVIGNYKPPIVIQNRINNYNAQERMEL